MPDVPEARRRTMAAIRGRNTKPEMVLRRTLHAMGYRFRVHRRNLPGTPDLVFPGRRAAIQVHGCFWHHHSGCKHATVPSTRREYWSAKLERNVERDRESAARLEGMGWRLLVVWECELAQPAAAAARAADFLGPPGAAAHPYPGDSEAPQSGREDTHA
ncbi:very short patch repair endonuclease (plasmid) [Roseomonas mucosa]|nr:very short patch repair endonuclease [Roseomonas mucosa]